MANNFVAKHARAFNKSATFVDRKKQEKRGVSKHKQRDLDENEMFEKVQNPYEHYDLY